VAPTALVTAQLADWRIYFRSSEGKTARRSMKTPIYGI